MNFQGTRSEMHQHSNSKIHEILLLSTIKNLKEQSNQKDVEIEQLKETNANKDETLNELKRDFEYLKNQFQQMKKKNETKEAEKSNLLNEYIENQMQKSQELINDVDNLKKFSERTSRLHHTLSDKWLRSNLHYRYTLFNEHYDQDEEVQKWNEMVNEINEDENECNYLKTLKSSINRHKETIYSTSYEKRLLNFHYSSPLGRFQGAFIRIGCSFSLTKSICVNLFTDSNNFKREVENNDQKRSLGVHHDYFIYSYYIGDCLHLSLFLRGPSSYSFLLHKSNEKKKRKLPNGQVVQIYDIANYIINSSIVLWVYLKKLSQI